MASAVRKVYTRGCGCPGITLRKSETKKTAFSLNPKRGINFSIKEKTLAKVNTPKGGGQAWKTGSSLLVRPKCNGVGRGAVRLKSPVKGSVKGGESQGEFSF